MADKIRKAGTGAAAKKSKSKALTRRAGRAERVARTGTARESTADRSAGSKQRTAGPNNFESNPNSIESEALQPIDRVVRELTSPDGTVLRVEVPVYPPFRLKRKSVEAA